jgi:poly(3-hydroxybutyrate) depolymerase
VVAYPETDGKSNTSVVVKHWDTGTGVQVRLYTLQGSGHVIPSKIYHFPRIIGPNASDISGPEEIVQFFEQVLDDQ